MFVRELELFKDLSSFSTFFLIQMVKDVEIVVLSLIKYCLFYILLEYPGKYKTLTQELIDVDFLNILRCWC